MGMSPGYAACIASGSGLCSTLSALGASDAQLNGVGTGSISDTELLDYLTGNTAAPYQVAPSVSSSATDTVLGSLGSVADAVSDPVQGQGIVQIVPAAISSAVTSASTFLSNNWVWILLAVGAVLLILVWAYGGFRLGFLQG